MKDQIIKIVSEATKVEEGKIDTHTSFVDDLNLDSLDMVEMMMKVEDEFGVEIPEDETENLKTIGDVIKFIESKK